MIVFDDRWEWVPVLNLGPRRAGELVLSSSLSLQRVVDVIKWTEDWAERVEEGDITRHSSSSAEISIDRLLGVRIPELGNVGLPNFSE